MILHVSGISCVKATTCFLLYLLLQCLKRPCLLSLPLPIHAFIYTIKLKLSFSGWGFGVSCFWGDPAREHTLVGLRSQVIHRSYHRHSKRDPSTPSSPCGIVGSRAERVKPQKRGGLRSFFTAENFQPIWEPQVLHWAIVHAYLRTKYTKRM